MSLRPEVRLLLLASRAEIGADDAERLEALLSGPIDWEDVLALAEYHRVSFLLHRNLEELRHLAVPGAIREKLAGRFEANRERMAELATELYRIIDGFEARGIKALPLKGPSLAARLYGDVALRPAGDLDILVTKADIPAALEVLGNHGYSLKFGKAAPSPGQRAAVYRFLYDFNLVDNARDFSVELHFGLSPNKFPFRVTPEELIETASSCLVGDRCLSILNDEENLIYLCVHGGKHAWVHLEWVAGVAELMRRMGKIDEQRLWHLAERRGAGTALLLGLSLAHRLLGLELPVQLGSQAEETPVVRELSAEAFRLLGQTPPNLEAEERFQWDLCPTIARKLRWLFCTKFQPERADIKFADFPAPFLYYFIRPVRMARQCAVRCVRKTRRTATA